MRPGSRSFRWRVGGTEKAEWAPGWQTCHFLLQCGQAWAGTLRHWARLGEPHQGLIGRQEGGPTVIPTDGQRHGAKLLTGEVRGGMASEDHWLLVIVLERGQGEAPGGHGRY